MSSYSSHRGRRYAAAALVTVAIAALLSACGSSSSGSSSSKSSTLAADTKSAGSSSGTPFRVLWICPASGPLAAAGNAELTGMEAAVTYVNSHGGVLGHKVELKTVDDGGAGTRAVSAAEQALASGTQYNLLYNGCFTQDGVPAAATFAKTPAVQFAPLPDQLVKSGKYPYAFLSGSLLSAPELGIATELKNKGLTKFAILTGDDPSGQTGAAALQAAAKSLGLTVTATQFVPDTAVNATAQLQAALASHPQALAVTNFTPTIGPILKARSELSSSLPLYGDVYFSSLNLGLVTTAAERKGVVLEAYPFMVHGTPVQSTPAWQSFEKETLALDPHPALSVYAPVTGWDSLMEARAGAVKAGTISGAAVPQALAGISSASQVPAFFGASELYSPGVHAWNVAPGDWDFVPAGVTTAGIIHPGT